MSGATSFQQLVRLLSPYRSAGVVRRESSADLGPGSQGRECAAFGLAGVRELSVWGALEARGESFVHLWHDGSQEGDLALRQAGFSRLWSNELLEAGARGLSQKVTGVSEIQTSEELERLARAVTPENAPRLSLPNIRALCANREGSPAGGASFARDGGTLYVSDVYVHPRRRGSGVGHGLLCALAEIARIEGDERLWALPTQSAQGFYASLGFRACARLTTYGRRNPA